MSSVWDVELYRVRTLVDKAKDDAPVNTIDFKRDLKPDVSLQKTVTMRTDGRPELLSYHYDGVLIAVIHIYFILSGGIMQRRTECLHYIKDDGSESPKVVIRDEFYGADKIKFAIDEKKLARHLILSEIKATILVALTWANPTLSQEEVVALGVTYSTTTKTLQDSFEEYGYPFYKDFVTLVDVTESGYEWLATPIGGGANLKDYILGALTYTSESNHPDA